MFMPLYEGLKNIYVASKEICGLLLPINYGCAVKRHV
jgi:hypothetical protein